MKKLILVLLCSWTMASYAQSDDYYKRIVHAPTIFKSIGSFITGDFIAGYKNEITNGKSNKVLYMYSFKAPMIKVQYYYPQVNHGNECGYLMVNNKKIDLNGTFEGNFGCELDPTSFNVYKGSFKGHQYVLLTCINTGSGSSSSSVMCNLFDVTDKDAIKYYPLWSKYGSQFSFGDFNKDGVLDFLQSRIKGENDVLKITLLSLKGDDFKPNNDKYILVKQSGTSLKTLERHWYN